ncbi:MAG TPA: ABC transporter ATP-binding protein [Candidatus Paceibacterota bacterium]
MLKVKDLSKVFEDSNQHHVIDQISMEVEMGEFVCILGPSGSGKTVFLYLIAGFLEPTSGEITLGGQKVIGPDTDKMMIFQDSSLFPWRTVHGNIVFGLENSNLLSAEKNKMVLKYLNLVGLEKYKDWYPHKLSGGMRQKVIIARSLISNPKILLLDEPFSALDPEYRKYMRSNLEKIWQETKKTIIFVTHSVNEALTLADRIYLFSNLPAKIRKTYKIDLPRPRDPRSSGFVAIAKDIEKEIALEFDLALNSDLSDRQVLGQILETQIKKI